LRPLVAPAVVARGRHPGHFCHPYDLCTKLIAEESGVVVTDSMGGAVNSPLDTESNIVWIGYANHCLQETIQPVLLQLIEEYGLQQLVAN